MSKKTILIFLSLLIFAFSLVSMALAGDQPAGTKTDAPKGKTAMGKMAVHPMKKAANEVAVCGCGKVFVPDANTKYFEYNGKSYACCSDGCHEMAMKDPAAAAKTVEDNMAKLLTPPAPPDQKK